MTNSTTKPRTLRLGTRGSQLARWQADWVANQLRRVGHTVELVEIATRGDADHGRPVEEIGTRGVFTKEIQNALLAGHVDIAVHSLKDLPTEPVDGLKLAVVPPRESPADVLVARHVQPDWNLSMLPPGARIGTGSLRRRAQLLHLRPDLQIGDIRGNLDTRLRKLDEGQFDAIVLAEAGLRRLGLADRISQVLPFDIMLPAVGQGALGIECRAEDAETLAAVAPMNDAATLAAVTAERALLTALRGGCMAPVGALGQLHQGKLALSAVVLSGDGRQRLQASDASPAENAAELGTRVAEQLIAQGADKLIDESRKS